MILVILFKLLAGHAFADFALQSDFIAKNKNRHSVPMGYNPELHGPMQTVWPYVLGSHAMIHGAFVYLATGRADLGFAEAVCHAAIDFGKCEKWYGIHIDQGLHIACKFLWLGLALAV